MPRTFVLAVAERVLDRGRDAGLGREVHDVGAVAGRRGDALEVEDVALDDLVVRRPSRRRRGVRW